jgi:tetratricopeptide (TPR) repeat protein
MKFQTPNIKHQRNPKLQSRARSFFGIGSFLGICFLVFVVSACRSAKPKPEPPTAVARAERSMSQAQGLSEQQNWPAAVAEWRRAADDASLLNDRTNEAIALHNLAQAQRQLHDYEGAISNALAATAGNEKLGRKEEWWRNQILLLQLEAVATNHFPERRFEELQPRLQEVGHRSLRGAFWNELALWQQKGGENERAAETFGRAQSEYEATKDSAGIATVIANRAKLLEEQGQLELALRTWSDALTRFEQLADPDGIAHSLAGHGRTLLEAKKDLSAAEDELRRAARNFRNLKMESEARKVEELLARRGEGPR